MGTLISIIVPIYNGESTLDRCVSSVLAQSYGNFELILVDDGSSDSSLELCRRYGDERITVISKENGGVSSARNAGIEAAAGDYVLFLDCDDQLTEGSLDRVAELCGGGYDVIALSLEVIRDDGGEPFIGFYKDAITDNVFEMLLDEPQPFGMAGGKVVRTAFIRDNGLRFDTSLHSQEDMRFFLRAYRLGKSFYLSPFTSYRYYYTVSGRRPPVKDHLENQVIALGYAVETRVSEEALFVASYRLCQNLFGYLAYAQDDNRVAELLSTFREIEGITRALDYCRPRGTLGKFSALFVKGKDKSIVRLMKNRRLLKKLLRRG